MSRGIFSPVPTSPPRFGVRSGQHERLQEEVPFCEQETRGPPPSHVFHTFILATRVKTPGLEGAGAQRSWGWKKEPSSVITPAGSVAGDPGQSSVAPPPSIVTWNTAAPRGPGTPPPHADPQGPGHRLRLRWEQPQLWAAALTPRDPLHSVRPRSCEASLAFLEGVRVFANRVSQSRLPEAPLQLTLAVVMLVSPISIWLRRAADGPARLGLRVWVAGGTFPGNAGAGQCLGRPGPAPQGTGGAFRSCARGGKVERC